MRRLLLVGKDLPNFPSTPWGNWLEANPLDYQGLILDCRRPEELPSQSNIANTLQTYVNNGHPVYVILPVAKAATQQRGAFTFIPKMNMYVQAGVGQTLNLRDTDPLFHGYIKVLEGHEIYVQLANSTQQQFGWTEGITDNVSRSVCLKVFTIYLLHPPPPRFEQKAFKTIIEHFKPDAPLVSSAPKPSWADEAASKLPGYAEAQFKRKSIQAEIDVKNEELRLQEEELRKLAGWADLLWLDGIPLQAKVSEAFNFLGVSTSSPNPTGHTGDLAAEESGSYFVFEVTGASGSIGIEKGRQLLQWVSEAPDPNTAKGVLVANAYKNQPPEKRPPTPDHRIFVLELESFAKKYHLALLDTTELYRVVCLKLSGKSIEKSVILSGLTTDGIARFSVA